MGFYMTQGDTRFSMAADNAKAATAVLKEMVWAKVVTDPVDLGEVILEWGWSVDVNPDGAVGGIDWVGDKTSHAELDEMFRMFQKIAPWVDPGSYISLASDEGDLWRWSFDRAEAQGEVAISWLVGKVVYEKE